MSNLPICVIGGGIAGICAIQTLADELPNEKILLITSSNLVKVTNNVERLGMNLVRFNVENQNLEQFKTNYPNVRVIIDKVINLDANNKCIKLMKSNESINYDKLAICTGASPKPLIDIKTSLNQEELNQYCCMIRDTETVKDLEKKFAKSKRVCIVGNGGIATELVFSIRFCKLVWIIRDQHITSTFLDAGAAHFLRNQILKDEQNQKVTLNESTNLSNNVIRRLKYTIIESENNQIDIVNKTYGSALGPDWQQKIELKGEYFENSKDVSFERNCELIAILRFDELDLKFKTNLGDELYRDSTKKDNWPIYVQLTNDRVIGCDLLINAIGVKPNNFLQNEQNSKSILQLASDDGILVDRFMQTNLLDIYAAGDCCTPFTNRLTQQINWLDNETEIKFEQNQIQTEHWHQIRLWTQARQMGIFMANSIASHKRNENLDNLLLHSCFDLFTHMTNFFGFKVILIGQFNGQHLNNQYEMLVRVEENKQYVKIILKDGKMRGCILIGDTDLEETFENLIINQLDIDDLKEGFLENTVDLEDYFD